NFYEIRFEVENTSSITHVFNYPNPFSSSTRFVYTLTGAEVPELFQIHIYTISGKLVKVVDLGELGDVHIGRNLTDYAWDGTDEYGDRLANGVYLYRIVTRMQSNVAEMELRDEGTSQYFNNGWGKMYILR
ncbi:MAG: T9SS C-terminal target domain-containing protein, partial [Bacteroidetes bacterium]